MSSPTSQGEVAEDVPAQADDQAESTAPPLLGTHFVGDLVLARLKARTRSAMDDARASVAAEVRTATPDGSTVRAKASILLVVGDAAAQRAVASRLAELRALSGPLSEKTYDLEGLVERLPGVQLVGPGGREEVPRVATLLEAVCAHLGIAPGSFGPAMHIVADELVVRAGPSMHARVERAVKAVRSEVAGVHGP